MNKKILILLLGLVWVSTPLQSSNENKLQDLLAETLKGSSVALSFEGQKITLTGNEDDVKQALKKLRDPNSHREVLVPTAKGKALTYLTETPINNWDEFIKAIGINPEEISLFNTKSPLVTDLSGIFTVETKGNNHLRMVQPLIDSLREGSNFFRWACQNIPLLLQQGDNKTVVNYGLLNTFLHLSADISDEDESVNSEYTATISSENLMHLIVASMGSQISLGKTPQPNVYSVNNLSLGDNYDARVVRFVIGIDNSGSMSGDPINSVNQQLPHLLSAIQKRLGKKEVVELEIRTFNTESRVVGTYSISKDAIPTIYNIRTEGGTDLRLIRPMLKQQSEERKIAFIFTDGCHNFDSGSLVPLQNQLRLQANSGNIPAIWLCKVGYSRDSFFEETADSFGGKFSSMDNVTSCFSEVTSKVDELMKARVPLVFKLLNETKIKVEQVPDHQVGVFQSQQTVTAGDKVKRGKGAFITVEDPKPEEVKAKPASQPEDQQESDADKISRLEAELARLKAGIVK